MHCCLTYWDLLLPLPCHVVVALFIFAVCGNARCYFAAPFRSGLFPRCTGGRTENPAARNTRCAGESRRLRCASAVVLMLLRKRCGAHASAQGRGTHASAQGRGTHASAQGRGALCTGREPWYSCFWAWPPLSLPVTDARGEYPAAGTRLYKELGAGAKELALPGNVSS